MSRMLILFGLILVALGLLWPWVARLGLGHLPGDIGIHRQHFDLYLPIASSLLASAVVSLVLWWMQR